MQLLPLLLLLEGVEALSNKLDVVDIAVVEVIASVLLVQPLLLLLLLLLLFLLLLLVMVVVVSSSQHRYWILTHE